MRLFVALDIEAGIRERLASFMQKVRPFASGARWVAPESLHVTLKFIGEQPEAMVAKIKEVLQRVSSSSFPISFSGYGFFPTERSARVFWIGIEGGVALVQLAKRIDAELAPLGIEAEKRAFSPHLTLARAGNGSGAPGRQAGDKPNRVFSALQAELAVNQPPDFGTMAAAEFFLYQSRLSERGARYTKIARFPMSL